MKKWTIFYASWKKVVYFNTIAKFEKNYNSLYNDYSNAHWAIFEYLKKHLWNTRKKWVKCYTNKFLHFENTFFSRDEKTHNNVKQKLQFFIDKWRNDDDFDIKIDDDVVNDLYIVMNRKLNFFLSNQYHNIVQQLAKTKRRLSKKLWRINIIRNFINFVNSYALKFVKK